LLGQLDYTPSRAPRSFADAPEKAKSRDGIAGAVTAAVVARGHVVGPLRRLVAGVPGLILLQSACTGFRPVYCTLDRCSPGRC
jgi:hypothetical protein